MTNNLGAFRDGNGVAARERAFAALLAGQSTWDTEDRIKQELGATPTMMSVFAIGPAGENMVRFACVMNELKDAAGRSGLGPR